MAYERRPSPDDPIPPANPPDSAGWYDRAAAYDEAPTSFNDQDDFAAYDVESAESHTLVLGGVLDFVPGDLLLNREGVLSVAQVVRLRALLDRAQGFVMWLALGLIAGMFILGVIFTRLTAGWLLLIALMALTGWLAWDVIKRMQAASADLPDKPVQAAVIRFDAHSLQQKRSLYSQTSSIVFFVEGDKQLHLSSNIYPLLRADQTYRAYYVLVYRTLRVVSIEPVGEWRLSRPVAAKAKRKPKAKRGL